ncbi:hypothetical protein GN958_ATG00709 [Phytophthora infestans]|uniref:Uncharacterized protein n=2 Tax=Phytophthora infestans TaxID=4787 RepID=A0A8S9VBN1_PHYIN|nr:hypothetical protein GN958_ATG10692 [Phytophthora infestans]KAF4150083.1 hypothetical protein GN958_ATG00709 [Phytophthora infestans]
MIKKRDLDEWARQEKAAQAAFLTLGERRHGSEKQSRFNQLDVVVPLSTRQLCCLEAPSPTQQNSTLPAQAAGCLVFTTERIESLQAENKKLRQQFRDLHKQ